MKLKLENLEYFYCFKQKNGYISSWGCQCKNASPCDWSRTQQYHAQALAQPQHTRETAPASMQENVLNGNYIS